MNVRGLYNNLNVFYMTCYRKYCLINPFFTISNDSKILTWYNYVPKESFYTYEEYYQWVLSNNQYSLEIQGKGLLQIYYRENDGYTKLGSLAFLPEPDQRMSYIRFDMDIDNSRPYYHNAYHANIGYNSDNVRFTLNRFPHPSEFVKFILFLFGNEEFKCFSRKRFFDDLTTYHEEFSHLFDFIIQ